MNTLIEGCWIWSCQGGQKEEISACSESGSAVGFVVTDGDAEDSVRWKQINPTWRPLK